MPPPAPPAAAPLGADDARRLLGLATLPVVLCGYAALTAAELGGPVRRTAGVAALTLAALLSVAVARYVLPRLAPVAGRTVGGPRALLAASSVGAPVLAGAVLATLQLVRSARSVAGAVVLLAPPVVTALVVAVAAGTGRGRPSAVLRVLAVLVLGAPPLLLAGFLLAYLTPLLVPLVLVPLHLTLVRAALPPR